MNKVVSNNNMYREIKLNKAQHAKFCKLRNKQQMKAQELLNLIDDSNKVHIFIDDEEIYTGYLCILNMKTSLNTDCSRYIAITEQIKDMEVKEFAVIPEIKHKEWEKHKLRPPLEPQELPQYRFSDLQMNWYYTLYL